MENVLKKIGFIGRGLECFIGKFHVVTEILFLHWQHFQLNAFLFLVFCSYLPRSVGMRRIALHKSISAKGDKMYLLVCECSDLLTEISSAAVLIPTIRARLCGYTGLYRPIQVF